MEAKENLEEVLKSVSCILLFNNNKKIVSCCGSSTEYFLHSHLYKKKLSKRFVSFREIGFLSAFEVMLEAEIK